MQGRIYISIAINRRMYMLQHILRMSTGAEKPAGTHSFPWSRHSSDLNTNRTLVHRTRPRTQTKFNLVCCILQLLIPRIWRNRAEWMWLITEYSIGYLARRYDMLWYDMMKYICLYEVSCPAHSLHPMQIGQLGIDSDTQFRDILLRIHAVSAWNLQKHSYWIVLCIMYNYPVCMILRILRMLRMLRMLCSYANANALSVSPHSPSSPASP